MFARDGVGFNGLQLPAAWPPVVTSDDEGRVTIPGVALQHGVLIEAAPTKRTAPQQLSVNTGMPEERGPRDGTYRSAVVKNLKPGEEGVFVLAPAQPVGGRVTYEDTGDALDSGRVTVYSSDQKFGSSIGLGASITAGRYRTVPYPGIRFRVTAYPAADSPYLPRQREFDWESNEKSAAIDIRLPRGVLVRGQVIDQGTLKPVTGARIEYRRQGNRDGFENVVAGWQAAQVTDAEGRFAMAVFPGRGHFLVNAAEPKYVLHEMGGRMLASGKPGGDRVYAHAFHDVDLPMQQEPVDLTIGLTPSVEVSGTIVHPDGRPASTVAVVTDVNYPGGNGWRGGRPAKAIGGRFTIAGWPDEEPHLVSCWDAEQRLGATVRLSAKDAGRDVRIQLEPSGSIVAKLVSPKGSTRPEFIAVLEMVVTPGPHWYSTDESAADQLAGNSVMLMNIDQTNFHDLPKSDADGILRVDALIPGATYQIVTTIDGRFFVAKEFVVESGKTLDLGDVVLHGGDDE